MSPQAFRGTASGNTYLIQKELGSGGQGRVYRVRDADGAALYAAKWYKPGARGETQRQQLAELVSRGAPCTDDPGIHFIWPIEGISFPGSSGFGYLMPLIDRERFFTLNQVCNGRVRQPSLPNLCRLGYRLAAALETLHAAGLAYCDINLGNIMLDPAQGEILICDNDNVVVNNGATPIRGVWEFMAPEVALGQAPPNALSDLYSVAVLLYYLWLWEHPMEGRETLRLYSWDIPAKRRFFAEAPLFVFHPEDDRNSAQGVPELELHRERWRWLCPPRLRELFTQSFVEGVREPARRVRLVDWQRVFLELEANALGCPACGAVNLWDGQSGPPPCFRCHREIPLGLCLRVQHGRGADSALLAQAGACLRRHHLHPSRLNAASLASLGRVEPHPRAPGHLILRNLSERTWDYQPPQGEPLTLEPGQARPLLPGLRLTIQGRPVRVEPP